MALRFLIAQMVRRQPGETVRERTAPKPAASRLERYIADIPPDRYRASDGAEAILHC